jgi:hypothetical protein
MGCRHLAASVVDTTLARPAAALRKVALSVGRGSGARPTLLRRKDTGGTGTAGVLSCVRTRPSRMALRMTNRTDTSCTSIPAAMVTPPSRTRHKPARHRAPTEGLAAAWLQLENRHRYHDNAWPMNANALFRSRFRPEITKH